MLEQLKKAGKLNNNQYHWFKKHPFTANIFTQAIKDKDWDYCKKILKQVDKETTIVRTEPIKYEQKEERTDKQISLLDMYNELLEKKKGVGKTVPIKGQEKGTHKERSSTGATESQEGDQDTDVRQEDGERNEDIEVQEAETHNKDRLL